MKKVCLLVAFVALSFVAFAQEKPKQSKVEFRGYGYVGTALAKKYALGTADVNLGMLIVGRVYIGIETGFHTRYTTSDSEFTALSKDVDIEKWPTYRNEEEKPIINWQEVDLQKEDFKKISITTPRIESYVPIGVNLKAYFTKHRKVVPFLNISFGGLVGCCAKKGVDGLYCQLGAGVDIYRFSLSAGYYGRQVMAGVIEQPSSGYIKVGWRF